MSHWVIASLRQEQFTSLPQFRTRIYEQIDACNRRPFQNRQGSRLSVFTTEEKPVMQPLPAVPFEISTWTYRRKVGKNGHVVWAMNSTPSPLVTSDCPLTFAQRTPCWRSIAATSA
jgi:hypothetical protein